MRQISPYIPFILRGIGVTAEVFFLALLVATPAAFLLGLCRDSSRRILHIPAAIVVEFFRGTSALVQLFWAFYALPLIGISLSPILCGVLVIGLNEGSYASEIVRAGLRSVPRGQTEAARALSLPPWRLLVRIVLPEAFPIMIPSITNSIIDLLKFTSLVSLVTVQDLTARVLTVQQTTGVTVPTLSGALIIYFVMSLIIAFIMGRVEARALSRVGVSVTGRVAPRSALRRIWAVTRPT